MIVQLNNVPQAMTRKYDSVLCFGDSDWWYHNRGHADMQFMRRFARQTRVVYVNSLGVGTPSVSEGKMFVRKVQRKLRSMSRYFRDGGEGFEVLSPVYAPGLMGLSGSVARSMLVAQLRLVLRLRNMKKPLVWVVCPTASVVLSQMIPQGVVHQLSDCYGALRGGDSCRSEIDERSIAERADLIVCSSRRLLDRARLLYGKGEYVDHGVDFEAFRQASLSKRRPAELAGIKPPVIGFYGNLDSNTVDRALLDSVIRQRPQYSFVLVGDMSSEFESLKSLPNMVAIPRQPYQRIPDFGAAFDVCLMPWLQNDWIEHCNPVKFKEYLALGKPVVSTPFPELDRFAGFCLSATGASNFAGAIDRALNEDSPAEQDRRKAWVANHSWDDKFGAVLAMLKSRGIEADV